MMPGETMPGRGSRVLVTGATGFVGRSLCDALARSGFLVRAAVRDARRSPPSVTESAAMNDLGADTQWGSLLRGVDCVIHLAARAHILNDPPANAEAYRRVNTLGTLNLAIQAAEAGARRFIFLSSVKVNGEATPAGSFTADDAPAPADAYGESKLEAERHVLAVGASSAMEVAIVRPPLIYGPGVKANFLRLMRWVDKERLLPLGGVSNRRSLVSIWNLCDLLMLLIASPHASRRVWMVSDGDPLSTPELIRRLARAMHRRARLVPVPAGLLRTLAAGLGFRGEVERLCGSLVVDISATQRDLGWSPPVAVDEALSRTAQWYLSQVPSRAR
jgi:nucleoside-diphosphate-sugar epimerase